MIWTKRKPSRINVFLLLLPAPPPTPAFVLGPEVPSLSYGVSSLLWKDFRDGS